MRRLFWAIALIAVLLLSACGVSRQALPSVEMPAATSAPAFGGNLEAGAPAASLPLLQNDASKSAGSPPVPGAPAPGSDATSTDRLVIQTADLTIVVKDVNARVKSIEDMASTMGGFLVSVNVSQTYASDGTQVPQAQIVVRVPSGKIDDALNQVKQDTVDVQNETRAGQDVTNQYVDLQSRLTAKQAAQDQLLKIMQNATKTQDVLDVYAQLQQVQSDIEVLKGQIQYMQQSAAMSAISVNIIAEATIKPIQVGGWKPQGVARDALQSLIYFWQDFVDFLIRFFLYLLPVLITIGIPIYVAFLLLRWILRKLRRPKAKVVQADSPK